MSGNVDGSDRDDTVHTRLLPSRAFLESWTAQTVPARRAAICDAVDLHAETTAAAVDDEDRAVADMALLGVIADAMQALEDMAFLATAWDSPFDGLAHYVRATTYTPQTAQTFWQEVKSPKRWDDVRFEIFAGLSLRVPGTGNVVRTTDVPGSERAWGAGDRALFDEVANATVRKLRRVLGGLADDWMQFLPYFQSFKHGGLAVNRMDTFFVDDDVQVVDEHTVRHVRSIAAWTRGGRKQELVADFNLTSEQVATMASSAGRLCLDMVETFVQMRLWIFDAVKLTDDGRIAGWQTVQIPMTDWLSEVDLPQETWRRIGRGPRLLATEQSAGAD